jgi:hypothetical protein
MPKPDWLTDEEWTQPKKNAEPQQPEVVFINGAKIKPEPVAWLWRNHLQRGALNLLAGRSTAGKSTIALSFAATITSGGKWPDGQACEPPEHAIFWSGEDDVRCSRTLAEPRSVTAPDTDTLSSGNCRGWPHENSHTLVLSGRSNPSGLTGRSGRSNSEHRQKPLARTRAKSNRSCLENQGFHGVCEYFEHVTGVKGVAGVRRRTDHDRAWRQHWRNRSDSPFPRKTASSSRING